MTQETRKLAAELMDFLVTRLETSLGEDYSQAQQNDICFWFEQIVPDTLESALEKYGDEREARGRSGLLGEEWPEGMRTLEFSSDEDANKAAAFAAKIQREAFRKGMRRAAEIANGCYARTNNRGIFDQMSENPNDHASCWREVLSWTAVEIANEIESEAEK